MELKLLFTILGILLTLGAFVHYFHSVWRGKTKPHVYTWLTFSLLLGISFFIQREHGGGLGTYVLLVDFVCCFIAFIVALKYGERNITRSDNFFLAGAIVTLLLWLIFDQVYLSVVLIIIIDLFAILPTFRKSYSKPYEETVVMYFISGCIFLLSLLAIENYSFLTTGHQLAIILFDWILVVFILWRRKILTK